MELLFDIEFRHSEGEETLFGEPIQGISLASLGGLDNTIYDYLFEGYEMWIRRRDRAPLTQMEIQYVLREEANNMAEDGFPLRWRMLKDAVVLTQDQSVPAFGKEAYDFFKEYASDAELNESFTPATIRRFGAMNTKDRQQKKTPMKNKKK